MKSSKILTNGLIYTAGNSLNALLPLLLIPFLTDELDNEDYASIAIFQMLVFFLTPILSLESISAVARSYFDKKVVLPVYITSALTVALTATIGATLFLSAIYIFSAANLYVSAELAGAAIVYCFLMYPFNLVLAILINRGEPLKYSFLALAAFFINLGMTFLLFYMFQSRADLRIFAQVITAALLAMVCGCYLIRSKLLANVGSRQYARDILTFSSPLIVHTLGGSLLGMGPQLALTFYGITKSVSDYSIALQIGSAIGLICVGANKAIAPWLQYSYEQDRKIIGKYSKIIFFSWISCLLIYIIYLFIEPVLIDVLNIFVNSRYSGYSLYLKWVVVGFLANGIYLLYVNILICRRQTLALASMSISSGLVGLGVSFAAVLWLGPSFAGVGIATAFVALAVSVGIYATRKTSVERPDIEQLVS